MDRITIYIDLDRVNCSGTFERNDRFLEIVQRNVLTEFTSEKWDELQATLEN